MQPAALLHARVPLTTLQLATALDWPQARVTEAVETAEQHPDLSDPAVLVRARPDAFTVQAQASRLTEAQRLALTR